MSLRSGRTYLAIPGPSVMPDRVLREMHRAAPNIYSGELVEMVPELICDLKTVAAPAMMRQSISPMAMAHGRPRCPM